MKLLLNPKILIKIISYRDEYPVSTMSLPIKDGLSISGNNNSLVYKVNNENIALVEAQGKLKWIGLSLSGTKRYPLFQSEETTGKSSNSSKKSNCPRINFNKNLVSECFGVIQEKMDTATNQYFEGKEQITLILDINEIVKETLLRLKIKKTDYIKKEKDPDFVNFEDLERMFSKGSSEEKNFKPIADILKKRRTPPK